MSGLFRPYDMSDDIFVAMGAEDYEDFDGSEFEDSLMDRDGWWLSGSGEVEIARMPDDHLRNAIRWLQRRKRIDCPKYEELVAEATRRGLNSAPPSATEEAQALIARGYMQVSSKNRTLARLPPGKTALEALAEVDPQAAKDIRERMEDQARSRYLRMYAADCVEVTDDVFRAFKRESGRVA